MLLQRGANGRENGLCGPEIRRPKSEDRKKAEARNPKEGRSRAVASPGHSVPRLRAFEFRGAKDPLWQAAAIAAARKLRFFCIHA